MRNVENINVGNIAYDFYTLKKSIHYCIISFNLLLDENKKVKKYECYKEKDITNILIECIILSVI